jgi:hypothetical protein
MNRTDENFDDWAEFLEARAREQSHQEHQVAILIEWLALVFTVLFIVVCAMWAKLT